jgi:hypothetical protein
MPFCDPFRLFISAMGQHYHLSLCLLHNVFDILLCGLFRLETKQYLGDHPALGVWEGDAGMSFHSTKPFIKILSFENT